jgi:hypothetical protein
MLPLEDARANTAVLVALKEAASSGRTVELIGGAADS